MWFDQGYRVACFDSPLGGSETYDSWKVAAGRRSDVREEEISRETRSCVSATAQNAMFFNSFVLQVGRKIGSVEQPMRRTVTKSLDKNLHAAVARSAFQGYKRDR